MLRTLLYGLALVLLSPSSDSTTLEQAGPHFKQGDAAYQKHEYDKAIAQYSEAIQLDPKVGKYYYARGLCYVAKGEKDKAVADFNRVIHLDPNSLESRDAYNCMGNVYCEQKDYQKALADYDAAIRLDGKDPHGFYNRGCCYGEMGDIAKSIPDFTEAIRLDPNYTDAYLARGISYSQEGEIDHAIDDYSTVIRLNPKNTMAYSNRGTSYREKHQYARAAADYESAVRLDSRDPLAYRNLAWLLATCPKPELRDGKRAVEHARKACDLTRWNDPAALDVLAAAYAELGDFDAAIRWEKKALELPAEGTPDRNPAALRNRLHLYEKHEPYRDS